MTFQQKGPHGEEITTAETDTEEARRAQVLARALASIQVEGDAGTHADERPLWVDHAHRTREFRPGSNKGLVRHGSGLDLQAERSDAKRRVPFVCVSDKGGGGIRRNNPSEVPGSVPFIHVPDARAAFEKALREGAEAILPPERVTEGVTIAIVRAPGGVPIGFSGP